MITPDFGHWRLMSILENVFLVAEPAKTNPNLEDTYFDFLYWFFCVLAPNPTKVLAQQTVQNFLNPNKNLMEQDNTITLPCPGDLPTVDDILLAWRKYWGDNNYSRSGVSVKTEEMEHILKVMSDSGGMTGRLGNILIQIWWLEDLRQENTSKIGDKLLELISNNNYKGDDISLIYRLLCWLELFRSFLKAN